MLSTIGQFFSAMEVEYRVYDFGHRVQEISAETFRQFEEQKCAYPSPYLSHAWLGFLFWHKDNISQPLIWFIKLPIDEQGLLEIAQRDLFLQQLLLAAGENLQAVNKDADFQEVLKNNPFVFTPTPEKQAYITSKARLQLQLEPSEYYQAAQEYLSSDLSNWQDLPVQGLADVAVNWQKHESQLLNSIPLLPQEPLISLCHLLENESINDDLFDVLEQRLSLPLDAAIVPAIIRAVSIASNMPKRIALLEKLLDTPTMNNTELLVTITSRCYLDLFSENLRLKLLTALTKHTPEIFSIIMDNLLLLPLLRSHILSTVNNKEQNPDISECFSNYIHAKHANLN